MAETFDVIVVGLGAAGMASLCQLAKRGVRALGIDRFDPPHDHGSSHGESRITRRAIGEGEDYVPLALRAHDLWREIEADTGEDLLLATGLVLIGAPEGAEGYPGKPEFFRRTLGAAERFGIDHEVLTPAEVTRRWPALTPGEAESVYYEPGAGLLRPERCLAAQRALALRHGATVRAGEAVKAVREGGDGVVVDTDRGRYAAGTVVVSAGAWAGPLLGGPWRETLQVYRQALHWFAPDDPAAFAPGRFPTFIWMHGAGAADWFYGFPVLDSALGVKLADERFDWPLSAPEDAPATLPVEEALALHARHVPGRVAGLQSRPTRSLACLYTMAPESRFLVGRDPERPRIVVASACSGHGFKHSSAVGEGVARLIVEGAAPDWLAPFSPG